MTQADLVFCEVPAEETVSGKILRHLKAGGTLTPLDALNLFQCFSLSQRIGELKRGGWPIHAEMVRVNSGKKVARYSLARAA